MSNEIQFLLYNLPDKEGRVQVVIKDETIWCTQKAMAELFGIDKSGISRHIANIFREEELQQDTTVAKIATSYLYDMIWLRIENAINTVLGKDSSDTSAMGRDFYKAIAFIMFKQKPWIGYGVDGFVCFLRDHPTIMGVYMKPVYSHCNYSELAADFGIVGLLLWYIPIVRIFYWGWQTKSSGYIEGCIYAIFVSIVISDYSRFPWDTHLSMYLLFIIVLLIRFDFLDKKRGNT